MAVVLLATGTPETDRSVFDLTNELQYAMGRFLRLEGVASLKPDTIVLSVYAIAPHRGSVPDRTLHKRSAKEFWSSQNIDFLAYVDGDARGKLGALSTALIAAMRAMPRTRATDAEKDEFEAAVASGVELLLSEPERLRPFEAPLPRQVDYP